MRPVFLIGYMGSGKSTLGRLVNRFTGLDFIDLDSYIENRHHKTVKEIFSEKGEEGFRKIEKDLLREVSALENVIIACGGGTPCFFDNIEVMNRNGTTVWLNAPLSVLHSRLMRGRQKRPLIADLNSEQLTQFIISALEKRNPYYSKALHRFDTALLENEEDRELTAKRFIRQFLPGYDQR